VSTGESSEEVSAVSPALAQAKAPTGTKSRTDKASSSAVQRLEIKLIFDVAAPCRSPSGMQIRKRRHQRGPVVAQAKYTPYKS